MNPTTKKIVISIAVTAIFLFVFFILISLRVIEPEEYAIEGNTIRKTLNKDEIFIQGRYVMRPATKLYRYSRVYYPIDFTGYETDLTCISSDGMYVTIDVVSQYRYLPDGLVDIFLLYGPLINDIMITMAKSAFINTCSYYEVESGFIQDRLNISNRMLKEYQYKMAYANISTLSEFGELRNYVYPDSYREAITDKQVAQQQIDLLLNQRPILIKNAQTQMLNASRQAEIDLQRASIQVDAIKQAALSESDAITKYWESLTDAFVLTLEKLNIDPDTFIETYVTTLPLDSTDKPLTLMM
jgi:regulator of protease activity HflC (stomatin/prohibitin superfamily)